VEVFSKLNEVDVKIKTLRRYANQRQKRKYKYVFENLDIDSPPDRSWHFLEDQVKSWPSPWNTLNRPNFTLRSKYRWIKRPVYTATMEYKYSLPSMSEAEAKLNGYLDTLGLKLDPSIVWNAIPFSFIVDWVIDVSGFLKSFSRDNFPITTEVVDFCHTVSWHYECSVDILIPYQSEFNFGPVAHEFIARFGRGVTMKDVYRRQLSTYERRTPGVSLTSHSLSIKSPGQREALLSGSLFLSNALGVKRTYRGAGR
jgi:hypothetical protein